METTLIGTDETALHPRFGADGAGPVIPAFARR